MGKIRLNGHIYAPSGSGKHILHCNFSCRMVKFPQEGDRMLQDLSYGKLEIEYHNPAPAADSLALCFRGGDILLRRLADDSLMLPTVAQAEAWAGTDKEKTFRYLFRLQGINCFLWVGEPVAAFDEEFSYEPARSLRQLTSKDLCFTILTGWHLYNWYRSNRFCGHCATPTVHDDAERMLRCPGCGNMIFPKISPAVIIAVTDGDRLLLSKYAGRSYTRYALLAGYTEIGETLEQTVQREVMEEVGLKVKNIRYYKSQPWGVDGNVLMGFYCDLDGDDTIHIDENELSMAAFYPRNNLPARDDGISLTREMIRVFQEGAEPK